MLVGSFNPTIFQPQWFARQNLLSQAEADAAKILVLVPQICDFETERFRVQVTTERFAAFSKPDTNPVPLRDLVLGTFFILEHTPVTAIGLNRHMHFQLETVEQWHALGDKLAPKEPWRSILKTGRPGMRVLVIEGMMDGSDGSDDPLGPKLTVKVEPSVQVKHGAFFEINEHYPAAKNDAMKSIMETLKTRWEDAYNYAAEISDYILRWAAS